LRRIVDQLERFLTRFEFSVKSVTYRGCKFLCPETKHQLIDFAMKNHSALIAVNAGKLRTKSPEIKEFINNNCGYPDGIGAVWTAKLVGGQQTEKMPGCELWLDIIRRFSGQKKFYLVGATHEVNAAVVKRLHAEFPACEIVGSRDGFFKDPEEERAVIRDICSAKPDFVFVALGSPKQENFILTAKRQWSAVFLGLGGSFDLYVGEVSRAPSWLIGVGLEWVYRVAQDPAKVRRNIMDILFVLTLVFDFILLRLKIKSPRV